MKQCLHLSIQSPAIEDTVSVPLEKVREFGDQQSISTSVRTPQKFAVNPQCQNSGKKFPSGVTCGDRRAASRPSLQVPCTFPQSHLRSGVGSSLGLLANRTLSERLFTAFCTWVP